MSDFLMIVEAYPWFLFSIGCANLIVAFTLDSQLKRLQNTVFGVDNYSPRKAHVIGAVICFGLSAYSFMLRYQ